MEKDHPIIAKELKWIPEELGKQVGNLEEFIACIFQLGVSLPEGPIRNQLILAVGALDAIAGNVRRIVEEI